MGKKLKKADIKTFSDLDKKSLSVQNGYLMEILKNIYLIKKESNVNQGKDDLSRDSTLLEEVK